MTSLDGISGSLIQTSLSGVSDQRRRLKFRLVLSVSNLLRSGCNVKKTMIDACDNTRALKIGGEPAMLRPPPRPPVEAQQQISAYNFFGEHLIILCFGQIDLYKIMHFGNKVRIWHTQQGLKRATSFSSSFKFGAGLASKNKGQTTSDALVRGASSDEEESTSKITSLGTE